MLNAHILKLFLSRVQKVQFIYIIIHYEVTTHTRGSYDEFNTA